ncbi:hypothetical protein HMPREF1585_01169 [Gardnerella vaginalis JCP8481B]|uniref:Uncharacterized protein n=1 Tax=Gardnerella vaginalis TaxID=2702 RepID=A0A133P344_GARVA|nr:hypothetical protein HMPREF1585_01169 [Gardnerella vaginalis JCP8481B]KXA22932.1 hypothetical protein HMPREF3208_00162 [Gardnerella vaginalis]
MITKKENSNEKYDAEIYLNSQNNYLKYESKFIEDTQKYR